MASPTQDGYRLAPFSSATMAELQTRFADPETWKPYNWFGFEHSGLPTNSPRPTIPPEGGMLAILDADDVLVGQVQWIPGFWYGGSNRSRAWNFGLIVFPEFRRTRATRAALALLVDYLFEHTLAHRLEATMPAEAVVFVRSLEALGVRREGIMRQAQWREGGWHDVVLLAVLRSEWAETHGR